MQQIYNYFSQSYSFDGHNFMFYGSISSLPKDPTSLNNQNKNMIDVRFRYRELELGKTAPSELYHFYIIEDENGQWTIGHFNGTEFVKLSNPVHKWLIEVVRESYKEGVDRTFTKDEFNLGL